MGTQKRPQKRGKPSSGTHRVKAHPRQNESGRVTRVKTHQRPNRGSNRPQRTAPRSPARKPVLQPSRARHNLAQAVKLRKRNGRKALGLGLAAVIELSAYVAVQGTVLLIAAVACLLGALALVIDDATRDD